MKHTFRFLANYDETNQVWNLTEEECQHFHRVLRLEDGALIEVFDGKGLQDRGPAAVESKTSIKLHSKTSTNRKETKNSAWQWGQ